MSGDDVLGLGVAVPLLGLFLAALLFPERF